MYKNKKVIFFDGDGTLWYPKLSKRTKKPNWIYDHPETKDNYLVHLELTPSAREVIEKLTDCGVFLVLISANPNPEHIAIESINQRVKYFDLEKHFHFVKTSPGDDPKGKSKVITNILKNLNLDKRDALMIGDSFEYDYLAACDIGVDAVWIENPVSNLPEVLPEDFRTIKELSDLLVEIN